MINIKSLFILLTFAKLSMVECDLDCTEDHPENCVIDGALDDPEWDPELAIARESKITKPIRHNIEKTKIPKNFDLRTAWPSCRSISRIKSQGLCRTCWSYCTTMVFADRVCIASGGRDQVDFSVVDLANCCKHCLGKPAQPPCRYGGILKLALEYAVNNGIAFEKCKRFDMNKLNRTVAKCEKQCIDPEKDLERHSHRAKDVRYAIDFPDPRLIQIEIMKHGPVCGRLENLTAAFMHWRQKGVFTPARPIPKPKARFAHSVRIIGWGTENGVDYWTVANTWGRKWGDNGFVKISRSRHLNDFGITRIFLTLSTRPLRESENEISDAIKGSSAESLSYAKLIRLLIFLCIILFLVS